SEHHIKERLRSLLPDYMIPSTIMSLDALPLNASGKIDRAALPRPQIRFAKAAAFEPRDTVESVLWKIWRSLLPKADFGVTDDFFDLGGDSIVAIQVSGRPAAAGLRITPAQIFANRTIESLTAVA